MPLKTNLNKYVFDKLPEAVKKKAVILPVMIVLVTIALLFLMKIFQPEPHVIVQKEKTWVVNTHVLVSSKKTPQIKMFAHVESPYSSVLTASISADVQSLEVREGQSVAKGQTLVLLDDIDVQIALEQRRADAAEIAASITQEHNRYQSDLVSLKLEKSLVALAEKKLEREKKTSQTNLTSQSSLDLQKQALHNQKLSLKKQQLNVTNHQSRLAQLEARRLRSIALVRQAELDVQRASIVAPFDSIVLKTSVSPGERVRSGETLLEVYAIDYVELRAQLPQKYVSIIKESLRQEIALRALVQTDVSDFLVTLDRVSGTVTGSGSGVDALFKLPAEQVNAFTIGETVEIVLSLPPMNQLFSVPVSSIYGTQRIYRVVDERLQSVMVEVVGNLFVKNKQLVLIKSSELKAGDEVITTQLPHAINGLKVERRAPLPASDAALKTSAVGRLQKVESEVMYSASVISNHPSH